MHKSEDDKKFSNYSKENIRVCISLPQLVHTGEHVRQRNIKTCAAFNKDDHMRKYADKMKQSDLLFLSFSQFLEEVLKW